MVLLVKLYTKAVQYENNLALTRLTKLTCFEHELLYQSALSSAVN